MDYVMTVRTTDSVRRWELDDWSWLLVLGALSAEPRTWDELRAALRRYFPDDTFADSSVEIADPFDVGNAAEWCVVDLVGQTIVVSEEEILPGKNVSLRFRPSDEDGAETPLYGGNCRVWVPLSPPWKFEVADAEGTWRRGLEARAAEARDTPPLDARAVVMGRPLYAFLAEHMLPFAKQAATFDEQQRYERTKQIHRDWLMTPREDLRGETPRNWLLARCDQVQCEMEHRAEQWSHQGFPPPPLPVESHAYRFGPAGVAEVVVYFLMIREVLEKGWAALADNPEMGREELIARLETAAANYLRSTTDEPGMDVTWGDVIESERRRLPMLSETAHLDDDCPICRAQAEGVFGPAFMWFDGSVLELEEEFAFSMEKSYEEWRMQQRRWSDFRESVAARLDAKMPDAENTFGSGVLSDEGSPEFARMMLSFPLANVIGQLQQSPRHKQHVEALNEAFDQFRRAQDPITRQSAAESLRDALDAATLAAPHISDASEQFRRQLEDVLAQSPS